MDRATDETLVHRVLRGSTEAANELFDRYWLRAWRTAYGVTGQRSTAEDVAQTAFYRAFRSLDRFDPRRPFDPWLQRIVINLAIDAVRLERRLLPVGDVPEPPVDWFEGASQSDDVLRALAALPAEKRAIVFLRYWLDLTPTEIGQVLNLRVGTVSSRLARALRELRSALEVNYVQ